MNRLWWLPFVGLLLAACTVGGPEVRQNLAQCELSTRAKDTLGNWDVNYIQTCMQAHGYVEDNNLIEADGTQCLKDGDAWVEADCYRSDDELAAWWAKEGAKPKKSN